MATDSDRPLSERWNAWTEAVSEQDQDAVSVPLMTARRIGGEIAALEAERNALAERLKERVCVDVERAKYSSVTTDVLLDELARRFRGLHAELRDYQETVGHYQGYRDEQERRLRKHAKIIADLRETTTRVKPASSDWWMNIPPKEWSE